MRERAVGNADPAFELEPGLEPVAEILGSEHPELRIRRSSIDHRKLPAGVGARGGAECLVRVQQATVDEAE